LDESELNIETAILMDGSCFTKVNYPWSFLYATSREGIPVISGLSILHTQQLRFYRCCLFSSHYDAPERAKSTLSGWKSFGKGS